MINLPVDKSITYSKYFSHPSGDPISSIAIACKETHTIHVFNARGDNVPMHVIEKLHGAQIAFIKYSPTLDLTISGMWLIKRESSPMAATVLCPFDCGCPRPD